VGGNAVGAALLFVVVGVIAGASGSRLVRYGILGAVSGAAILLPGVHSFVEAALRPARVAIAGDTGVVIAGTIGGGGKLEFTLIGDTVNVAARVEQLTKTTGDAILLTHQCVDALVPRPPGLTDRGSHSLKGTSVA
jgi:adenylate cyclase